MKKALGKGLSALIPDSYVKQKTEETVVAPPAAAAPKPAAAVTGTAPAAPVSAAPASAPQAKEAFRLVAVDRIRPNHDQVRREFDPSAIEELAASIREKGILQPVLVKEAQGGQYELICGERRWRAAQLCGLTQVPVVVKDIADKDFLEWALIENIQREDLNPVEEAEAYRRLAEERRLSQEDIAKKVGKNRTTVTNALRLLQLPVEIRRLIEEGQVSSGHARALLGLISPEHQRQFCKRIIEEGLSVRQVEQLVSRSQARKRSARPARNLTPEIVDLETRLVRHLGTQVKLYPRKNKSQGRIEIQYFSLDELDRVLEAMKLPQQ